MPEPDPYFLIPCKIINLILYYHVCRDTMKSIKYEGAGEMTTMLRAAYEVNGTKRVKDFIGEEPHRQLGEWMKRTAQKYKTFKYEGSKVFKRPLCWNLSKEGDALSLYAGTVPVGIPSLYITDTKSIREFIETYTNHSMDDIAPGMYDVIEYPEELVIEPTIKTLPRNEKKEAREEIAAGKGLNAAMEKMSKFEEWIRTFFDEKDVPVVKWTFEHNGDVHYIDNYDMLEIIIEGLDRKTQAQIKEKLVQIDFYNKDVNDFMKYLAKGYVETNY